MLYQDRDSGRAPAASGSYRSCLPVSILSVGPALIQAWRRARRRQGRYAPRKRGGLRPSLTAAARDTLGSSGRDEETALSGRTKKHQMVRAVTAGKGSPASTHAKQRGGRKRRQNHQKADQSPQHDQTHLPRRMELHHLSNPFPLNRSGYFLRRT